MQLGSWNRFRIWSGVYCMANYYTNQFRIDGNATLGRVWSHYSQVITVTIFFLCTVSHGCPISQTENIKLKTKKKGDHKIKYHHRVRKKRNKIKDCVTGPKLAVTVHGAKKKNEKSKAKQ